MRSCGIMPKNISSLSILESMGENIIIADAAFNIVWINPTAVELLANVVPLFGYSSVEQIIGLSMSVFHRHPEHQIRIMQALKSTHRARIVIKDRFVSDIIVNPIHTHNELAGYVVLLQDVTTKAEEEKRTEQIIHSLSVPILKIWNKTIAIPLFGDFDSDRGEHLVSTVLKTCSENRIQYVLVDLSGLMEYKEETASYLKKLYNTLRLIGAECILVGISPELAKNFTGFSNKFLTFSTSQQGLNYILKKEEVQLPEINNS